MHPAVPECAVTQLYRYAQGRTVDQRDFRVLWQLVDTFSRQDQDLMALVKSIALSSTFRLATAN